MFIPAAGYITDDDLNCAGDDGSIWTSSLCLEYNDLAHYLYFETNDIKIFEYSRCAGFPVRPVINL